VKTSKVESQIKQTRNPLEAGGIGDPDICLDLGKL
jgi:hypothetical protein